MILKKQTYAVKKQDRIIAVNFEGKPIFSVYRDNRFDQLAKKTLSISNILLAITISHDFNIYFDSITEHER